MTLWPVLLTVSIVGLAWQPVQDLFVAQRDAAAARNPHSARFTIALEAGRRSFRIGEGIPILLTYDDLHRSPQISRDLSYRHFADAVVDRTDGTAQPFVDFQRAGIYVSGAAAS